MTLRCLNGVIWAYAKGGVSPGSCDREIVDEFIRLARTSLKHPQTRIVRAAHACTARLLHKLADDMSPQQLILQFPRKCKVFEVLGYRHRFSTALQTCAEGPIFNAVRCDSLRV